MCVHVCVCGECVHVCGMSRRYMWQSRIEIEYYSALVRNELVALIKALGLPQRGAQVSVLFVASTSSYTHESALTSGLYK